MYIWISKTFPHVQCINGVQLLLTNKDIINIKILMTMIQRESSYISLKLRPTTQVAKFVAFFYFQFHKINEYECE